MFHTHQLGREAYAKVIRDGKEVSYLFKNKYYDFNYQYYSYFETPFNLKMVLYFIFFIS